MEVLSIFATPLATSKLDFDLDSTLDYVKNIPFELVGDKSCEYSVNKHLLDLKVFSNIVEQIKQEANLYASEVLCYNINHSDYSIDLKTSWSIKMKPGDYAGSHYHSQALFTGILYLSVDDSNKLVLHTPHGSNPFAEVPMTKKNMFNDTVHRVIPKEKDLIFFPSYISHYAEKNESDKTLYCLVFDFSVKGTLHKNMCSEMTFSW